MITEPDEEHKNILQPSISIHVKSTNRNPTDILKQNVAYFLIPFCIVADNTDIFT